MFANLSLRIKFLLVVTGIFAILLSLVSVIILKSIQQLQEETIANFSAVLVGEKKNEELLLKDFTKQNIESISVMVANLSASMIGNYDYVALESLVKVTEAEKGVAYLLFLDSDGKKITKEDGKKNKSSDDLIYKKIIYDNKTVGQLEVGIDYSFIEDKIVEIGGRINDSISQVKSSSEQKNNALILIISIMAIVCLIFLSVIIYFMTTKSIINPIKLFVNDLQTTSSKVNLESKNLLSISSKLSAASNEQASSIEKISVSVEELSGMVENNVRTAQKTQSQFQEVKNESIRGDGAMKELVSSMQDIIKSTANIEQLVKFIGEIAEKTKIIDEIVFQTKLLSFNASVEAERAGEHGRGFAVVAQEVGNLAQMSGKSATEISSIVKSSIDSAKNITATNNEKVRVGGELVAKTAKVLTKIIEISDVVSQSSNDIVEASQEQSTGIKQINLAISEFEKQVQENNMLATQTADSSSGLDTEAQSLEQVVSKISSMVN